MDNPNLSVMKESDSYKLWKESANCLSQNGYDDLNVEVDKKTNQLLNFCSSNFCLNWLSDAV